MRNLAPTKSNLLKLKEELSFAELGKDLHDQKRSILVTELLALVDQAVSYEKSVRQALAKAFETLEDAVLAIGKLQVLSLSGAVNMDSSIMLGQRKVMGVSLPVVETTFTDRAPYFSALGADFRVDLAVNGFREALGLMGRFAELKVSITRLAMETHKTIRKVNALEKIAIPELDETISHINGRLEESERDIFVLMKMVKDRLAKAETEA
ncbi:MAG: V-type ATP synthase subunit D [Spirochaetia bacterium]|jgi:V/A-type H+-transporting ATPase subunit D|nr:V-type ATP synthase subunit D [Spirochaetia bacterium]